MLYALTSKIYTSEQTCILEVNFKNLETETQYKDFIDNFREWRNQIDAGDSIPIDLEIEMQKENFVFYRSLSNKTNVIYLKKQKRFENKDYLTYTIVPLNKVRKEYTTTNNSTYVSPYFVNSIMYDRLKNSKLNIDTVISMENMGQEIGIYVKTIDKLYYKVFENYTVLVEDEDKLIDKYGIEYNSFLTYNETIRRETTKLKIIVDGAVYKCKVSGIKYKLKEYNNSPLNRNLNGEELFTFSKIFGKDRVNDVVPFEQLTLTREEIFINFKLD